MLRFVSVALAVSSVAALQPPLATKAKANPAAVDLYSRATATSAARDVALYGMFGPSEAEKRAEQARIDAEQEALNEKFRKESESDFAFMSVFGVVTCVGGVRRK
jgi:Skp family chaperone for outer membrane proteins